MTIQERAIESLMDRRADLVYNFQNMSSSHQEKVTRQCEVLDYLIELVCIDKVRKENVK